MAEDFKGEVSYWKNLRWSLGLALGVWKNTGDFLGTEQHD